MSAIAKEFANHIQWSAVKEVCERLKAAGHKALLAGGCVRDLLMKRVPNDFDIATDATPDEVAALFPKAILVGKAFGVIMLPYPGFQLEVATFREDLEYKDGRRPEGVRFSDPETDANRRDFTVNALFYDLDAARVIDYVGGEADLKAKIIRTVGEADRRFDEDQLRLLRAVRFSAQLEFTIEPTTLEAVRRRAASVGSVSRERVRDEVLKLLKCPARAKGLELLISTGLLREIAPELDAAIATKGSAAWIATFAGVSATDAIAQLALFFAPIFKRGDERAFRDKHLASFKLESRLMDAVIFVLKNLDVFASRASLREGELVLLLSHEAARSALVVAHALTGVETGALEALATQRLGPEWKKPEALVAGADARAAGLAPGPGMGAVLHEAYLNQLEGRISSREQALEWLARHVKGSTR